MAEGAPPPAWDTSRMATSRCDVANAAVTGAEVVVHAGVREAREDGTQGVALLHTLHLTPWSARRLQELLALLVREHDRRRGGPS